MSLEKRRVQKSEMWLELVRTPESYTTVLNIAWMCIRFSTVSRVWCWFWRMCVGLWKGYFCNSTEWSVD